MAGEKGKGPVSRFFGKFEYNSPVILTYAFICVAVFIADFVTGGRLCKDWFTTYPDAGLGFKQAARAVLYIFGHASLSHLTGNMTLFLLVGPIVEEKYGSDKLVAMIFSTGIITAVINGLFFHAGMIGASGIVFMLIILCSFAGGSEGRIPITLVLVFVIYVGGEVASGIFSSDNISHFGHIAGGVCGLGWGAFHKKLIKR